MRVVFAEDAIRDSECWRYLDQILASVDDGWHEWEIDDPEFLETSDWLQGSNRPLLPKLFEQAVVRTAYSSQTRRLHHKGWVVSHSGDSGTLAPRPAARLFSQPLKIYVENRRTDGPFVDTLLEFLAPAELRKFLADCHGRPLEYDSGGGTGELPKLIRDHVEQMAKNGLSPRAVVIADSDAPFPGARSSGAVAVFEASNNCDIDVLILSKREIENYIPDEVLLDWAADADNSTAQPRVEAVCRLSAEQRDHLPMKKRFPPSFKTDKETDLYNDIPQNDRKLLRKADAFDNKLIESLKTHRQHLSADALRQRDGKGELDDLVAKIANAL